MKIYIVFTCCQWRLLKVVYCVIHQLTQQLEDLRRGRLQLQSGTTPQGTPTGHKGSPLSGPAAVELRKLYQELQVNATFSQTSSRLSPQTQQVGVLQIREALTLVWFRLVTVTIWSRAASWPKTRSCWTRGTPRWRWWTNASVTWGNAFTRREQR